MSNILVVTEVKGFRTTVIKERLEQLSYQVFLTAADTDEIHKLKDAINAIMILTDDTLVTKQQHLNYLKDRVIADNIPLFLIGEQDELDSVKSIFAKKLIDHEFIPPIDIPVLVKKVDELIKAHHTHKKILVVDDSGAMLRNVKAWLEDKYSIFLANSGVMAIKYLSLHRPDLVLLDYEMPVADGKQVLEMIRSDAEFADIPVIFLTGKSDRDYVLGVRDLKPEGYLLKTMEPDQIVKAVDDFFEKRKGLIK